MSTDTTADTATPRPIIKASTGPFDDVSFYGHISVEERDTQAGQSGSTLKDADKSDLYRSTLPDAHEKFYDTLAKLAGLTPLVNEKATELAKTRVKDPTPEKLAAVKPVLESFVELAKRAKATVDEPTWKEIDTQFRAICLATPIDATPGKRGSGVSKANMEKAEEILTRSDESREATIQKLLVVDPTYGLETNTETGLPDVTSLAKLVGIFMARGI